MTQPCRSQIWWQAHRDVGKVVNSKHSRGSLTNGSRRGRWMWQGSRWSFPAQLSSGTWGLLPSKDLVNLSPHGRPFFQGEESHRPRPSSKQSLPPAQSSPLLPAEVLPSLREVPPAVRPAWPPLGFPTSRLPSQVSCVFLGLPLVNLWLRCIIRETRARH